MILNRLLIPALTLALGTAAIAQQTVPPPVTSQTPAQNQNVTPGSPAADPTVPTATAPALSKKQLKQQRNQQKHNEKAADQAAQAQKDQANALKHQDKATQEQQKANTPK